MGKQKPRFCGIFWGALGRTRTCDLLIRSQTLYPAELRALGVGRVLSRLAYDTAGDGQPQGGEAEEVPLAVGDGILPAEAVLGLVWRKRGDPGR